MERSLVGFAVAAKCLWWRYLVRVFVAVAASLLLLRLPAARALLSTAVGCASFAVVHRARAMVPRQISRARALPYASTRTSPYARACASP